MRLTPQMIFILTVVMIFKAIPLKGSQEPQDSLDFKYNNITRRCNHERYLARRWCAPVQPMEGVSSTHFNVSQKTPPSVLSAVFENIRGAKGKVYDLKGTRCNCIPCDVSLCDFLCSTDSEGFQMASLHLLDTMESGQYVGLYMARLDSQTLQCFVFAAKISKSFVSYPSPLVFLHLQIRQQYLGGPRGDLQQPAPVDLREDGCGQCGHAVRCYPREWLGSSDSRAVDESSEHEPIQVGLQSLPHREGLASWEPLQFLHRPPYCGPKFWPRRHSLLLERHNGAPQWLRYGRCHSRISFQ